MGVEKVKKMETCFAYRPESNYSQQHPHADARMDFSIANTLTLERRYIAHSTLWTVSPRSNFQHWLSETQILVSACGYPRVTPRQRNFSLLNNNFG